MKTDILVVGGGPAGILAGMSAKMTNPKLDVTLIKKEKGVTIKCSEPYVIGDVLKLKNIVFSDKMISEAGIKLIIDEATKVDTKKKVVFTKKRKINYKKLILATGANPFVPPIPGTNLKNVFTLRTSDDVKKIYNQIKKAKNIVIVGGGAIGIELASLLSKKKNVTIIEILPHLVYGAYDEEFSKIVEKTLKKSGIKILKNEGVKEIKGNKKVEFLVTTKSKKIKTDMVLFSTGVRSETKLARDTGIRVGKFGIWIKNTMETSIKDVYACGDCAQAIDFITKKPTSSQLATTAVFQGKVAGANAAGMKNKYDGVVNPAVSAFCGIAIGRVGFTEKQAKENGFKIVTGNSESSTKYPYHPGAKKIKIKLVFDKKTRRILGAQIFGGSEGVSQRINLLSLAIYNRMKIENLMELNYCAHPELTPLPFAEPIVMAAEDAMKKL